MKTQTTCRSNRCQVNGLSLIGCVIAGLLVMGSAQAQWRVTDNQLIRNTNRKWDADKKVQDAQKTRLDELYEQQKTYMDAYEARLRYLKAARDTLTQQALGGKSGTNPLAA